MSLFDPNAETGFRLKYFELYNWGTFDARFHRIDLDGKAALLTGDNGSGKTTLLDAILTLLVPSKLRFYNQSSGSDNRKERTEESYVLGFIGKTEDPDLQTAKTEKLREKSKVFSVLLGCFANQDRFYTLAQIRFYKNGELQKHFMVAPKALTIQDDLFCPSPEMFAKRKKELEKRDKARFFPSFEQYKDHFVDIFGFKSDKALGLFSQTVGVKVLGDVNGFVRSQMLDEPRETNGESAIRKNFDNLCNGFSNVERAKRAVEQAEKQIELLTPIVECGELYRNCDLESAQIITRQQLTPLYFARLKQDLLQAELAEARYAIENRQNRLAELSQEAKKLGDAHFELKTEITSDQTGKRVADLKLKISQAKDDEKARKGRMESYNALIKKGGLMDAVALSPDEAAFRDNLRKTPALIQKNGGEKKEASKQLLQTEAKIAQLKQEIGEIRAEIESLESRQNNLPKEQIRIRAEMLQALKLQESELPYAGELMRVKQSENGWEAAIEKVLRPFALSMLIGDERLYQQVNQYVNSRDLRGRLVYFRANLNNFSPSREGSVRFLPNKLELKEDSPYYDWLLSHLWQTFNFRCAEDMAEFGDAKKYEKALTANGLVRSGKRHEKDDRKQNADKGGYVLGWENMEKILLLRNQERRLAAELRSLQVNFEQLEKKEKGLEDRLAALQKLEEVRDYEQLNWQAKAQLQIKYQDELRELEKSSDRLGVLNRQLEALEAEIRQNTDAQDLVKSEIIEYKRELDARTIAQTRNDEVLQMYQPEDAERLHWLDDQSAGTPKPETSAQADKQRGEWQALFETQLNELKVQKARLERDLQLKMQTYKSPGATVVKLFINWEDETELLQPRIEYLETYIELHRKLTVEDLPGCKDRFFECLNDSLRNNIISFGFSLKSWETDIDKNIKSLNESLKTIVYNRRPEETYLQLVKRSNPDQLIKDFKQRLSACTDFWNFNPATDAEERDQQLRTFEASKNLIVYLKDNDQIRQRVLDVRNWYSFYGAEYARADENRQIRIYDDSGSLSGGQSAQLTYTILGAALAYQFNINAKAAYESNFRFIMVDEAFSKLDPEKSDYLMQLCDQLKLQLMVVTPGDKINVVEKHVQRIHYVSIQNNRSRVFSCSKQEFEELKGKNPKLPEKVFDLRPVVRELAVEN